MPFSGLILFSAILLPLVYFQRLLHREIQYILQVFTRDSVWTIRLFSLLFIPGVALHELSHLFVAWALRVRTGKISIVPAPLPDGRLQLGYVETARSDIFRDSLIGLAPMVSGSVVIAVLGVNFMQLDTLWNVLVNGQFNLFLMGLRLMPQIPDFYLWSYFVFTVSSTMMPSESDRDAWLPLGLWVAVLITLAVFAGAGDWMLTNLAPLLNNFLNTVSTLLGLSLMLHILLLLPITLIRRLLFRVTGFYSR